jgi:hypothetical protein
MSSNLPLIRREVRGERETGIVGCTQPAVNGSGRSSSSLARSQSIRLPACQLDDECAPNQTSSWTRGRRGSAVAASSPSIVLLDGTGTSVEGFAPSEPPPPTPPPSPPTPDRGSKYTQAAVPPKHPSLSHSSRSRYPDRSSTRRDSLWTAACISSNIDFRPSTCTRHHVTRPLG